jgi:molybdate-binding protein/DNA-binding XRE family transcriptional regulator
MPLGQNNLGAIRKRGGLTAAGLAKTIGVSRQTIYAIEAGTYVPNTEVALRLARALTVSVEDLFSLPATAVRNEAIEILPGSGPLEPGQPVQLCEVHGRRIGIPLSPTNWALPIGDALIGGHGSKGKTQIQLSAPELDLRNRILIAGCDPAVSLLARQLQPAGIELVTVHRNSSQALSLLKAAAVDIAGTHLRHRTFSARSVAVISFASWTEGLITAPGNPKQIRGVEDLARRNVRLINRELGSGARDLLDAHLKRIKLKRTDVRGYDCTAPGHLAAAREVKSARADCCVATEAAARVFGLHFIPLETARYDLVVRKQDFERPQIQTLFDAIQDLSFRRKLEKIGGYDTAVTGRRAT